MKMVHILAKAKSISLWEIPESYRKGMKFLNPNTGSHSLVFEKNTIEVRIFTRDKMKVEWLTRDWGLGMGELVDTIGPSGDGYFDRRIYIVDMMKLYPVKSGNIKIVDSILESLNSLSVDRLTAPMLEALADTAKSKDARRMLLQLARFISKYHDVQFLVDASKENFMETPKGQLVFLDAIADYDLQKALNVRKAEQKEEDEDYPY